MACAILVLLCKFFFDINCIFVYTVLRSPSGGMADAVDSKSTEVKLVGVQVPSRAVE